MASPTVIDAAWTFDDQNTAQNGRFVMGAFFQNAAASTTANSVWRDGVIPGTFSTSLNAYRSLHVTENSPTGSSVLVQAGHAVVTRTGQGLYVCPNSTARVVALDAADVTNPRIDRIVLQVLDTALGDGSTQVQIQAVTGSPSGSPVAPATPTGAISLATVAVAAAPTGNTIVNANITDTRRVAALNGTIRPLLPGDLSTDAAHEGDLRDVGGLIERYTSYGAKWVPLAITNGPLGYVSSQVWTTNGGDDLSGNEFVAREHTFTARANRRYRATWNVSLSASAATSLRWNGRWATGTSITTSSTRVFRVRGLYPGSGIINQAIVYQFTGPATAGNVTTGITTQTTSAVAVGIDAGGGEAESSVIIEDIGGV